jgi:hypothetical protein
MGGLYSIGRFYNTGIFGCNSSKEGRQIDLVGYLIGTTLLLLV